MVHHFGVSRPSLLYRLRNLRLVSQQEFGSASTSRSSTMRARASI
jgi:Zn-dependent peptidase ImmA (M78 family)